MPTVRGMLNRCMKKFLLLILFAYGCVLFGIIASHDAPALSFQQPMISAESINTRTITCNITFETVSHCQMKPNATLDSVVQEWYDLYRYELTEEQIHIK